MDPQPATNPADAGSLVFDRGEYDLGATKGDVRHQFRLTNRGPNVVRVGRVLPSCSCMATNPETSVLAPGEQTTLGVTIHLSGKEVGRHTFTVAVEYTDGEVPQTARAVVKARYEPDIRLTPAAVELAVGAGSPVASLSLVDFRATPLTVREVRSASPLVSGRVVQTPRQFASGWQHLIEVAFTGRPDDVAGEVATTISILTDDSLYPVWVVPVTVKKYDRIRVSPSVVRFDRSGSPATVIVRDTAGEPVEIAGVDVPDAVVQVDYTNTAAVVRLVTLRPTKPLSQSGSAQLLIRVTKPCAVTLPVTVTFGD